MNIMKAKKIKSILSDENISSLANDILKTTNKFKKTKDAYDFIDLCLLNVRNALQEEFGIYEKDIPKEKFEKKIFDKLCEKDSRLKKGRYIN